MKFFEFIGARLEPVRPFFRIRRLEEETVPALRAEIEGERQRAKTALREATAPLARCFLCGVICDLTHPAVTVVRRGTEPPQAACRWDLREAERRGFKPVVRETA